MSDLSLDDLLSRIKWLENNLHTEEVQEVRRLYNLQELNTLKQGYTPKERARLLTYEYGLNETFIKIYGGAKE